MLMIAQYLSQGVNGAYTGIRTKGEWVSYGAQRTHLRNNGFISYTACSNGNIINDDHNTSSDSLLS